MMSDSSLTTTMLEDLHEGLFGCCSGGLQRNAELNKKVKNNISPQLDAGEPRCGIGICFRRELSGALIVSALVPNGKNSVRFDCEWAMLTEFLVLTYRSSLHHRDGPDRRRTRRGRWNFCSKTFCQRNFGLNAWTRGLEGRIRLFTRRRKVYHSDN